MIAYKFTIEGEITAANAAKAYAVLTALLARIADSLGADAPQIELREQMRITLLPLPGSEPVAAPRPTDLPGRVVDAGGVDSTTSHLRSGSTDG
jgi:hypothetical protein